MKRHIRPGSVLIVPRTQIRAIVLAALVGWLAIDAHQGPMTFSKFLIVLAWHTLFFGIPLALTVQTTIDVKQVGK